MEETSIKVYQSHKPLLPSGNYKLTVTQHVMVGSQVWNKPLDITFSVAGEQFHLDPGHIGAHYPPGKGIARYENILPHIALNRSTLPWERSAVKGSATPWLAL
ncbi:MAG TPA: hypothetical protein VM187_13670, partial [Niastella sp.]|nr:hypothetical protein [Niastella sp.]